MNGLIRTRDFGEAQVSVNPNSELFNGLRFEMDSSSSFANFNPLNVDRVLANHSRIPFSLTSRVSGSLMPVTLPKGPKKISTRKRCRRIGSFKCFVSCFENPQDSHLVPPRT